MSRRQSANCRAWEAVTFLCHYDQVWATEEEIDLAINGFIQYLRDFSMDDGQKQIALGVLLDPREQMGARGALFFDKTNSVSIKEIVGRLCLYVSRLEDDVVEQEVKRVMIVALRDSYDHDGMVSEKEKVKRLMLAVLSSGMTFNGNFGLI